MSLSERFARIKAEAEANKGTVGFASVATSEPTEQKASKRKPYNAYQMRNDATQDIVNKLYLDGKIGYEAEQDMWQGIFNLFNSENLFDLAESGEFESYQDMQKAGKDMFAQAKDLPATFINAKGDTVPTFTSTGRCKLRSIPETETPCGYINKVAKMYFQFKDKGLEPDEIVVMFLNDTGSGFKTWDAILKLYEGLKPEEELMVTLERFGNSIISSIENKGAGLEDEIKKFQSALSSRITKARKAHKLAKVA